MKRCPECDFIYENDQRHCDMDGRELSFEPRTLPIAGGIALRPAAGLVKSQRRRFAVRVAAAVILGAVLFVAFYGFMHRTPAQDITYSSAKVIASSPAAPNLVAAPPPAVLTEQVSPSPSPLSSPTQTPHASAKHLRADDVTAPTRPITAPFRTPTSQPQEIKSDPNKVNPNKESKVGSFLKKTGRLLKKPFKF